MDKCWQEGAVLYTFFQQSLAFMRRPLYNIMYEISGGLTV